VAQSGDVIDAPSRSRSLLSPPFRERVAQAGRGGGVKSCAGTSVEGEKGAHRKRGGAKRRIWRKIHIGIDEMTLEIRSAEFTTSGVGGSTAAPREAIRLKRSVRPPPQIPVDGT
jgi:hypothetical protein